MKKDRILWADDEMYLLTPYKLFLEEKGYEVVTATNGNDAIELCQTEKFDIIFLDENMPGLSGLETLSIIKDIDPDVPMVMITKSEEEDIMNMAIGNKIADYLTKPVNPSQILLTLKKNIHRKDIITEHTTQSYQLEFREIGNQINHSSTYLEWVEVYKKLIYWELKLSETDNNMGQMLIDQKSEANITFAKFIKANYQNWFLENANRPLLSPDIFKTKVFPALDKGEKVFFVLVDNFRLDQWKVIRELLSEYYNFIEDDLYCGILPTATQYARNSIFAGLMPAQIQKLYPNLWVEEEADDSKNQFERELLQTQLDRFRKKYSFSYHKINDSASCNRLIDQLPKIDHHPLNVCVLNFIDMLSHARTDSKMMRELANDSHAYRSLTLSWFKHSSIYDLFKSIAQRGYKVVLTTDHGTIQVNNPIKIASDKNINNNLRYKTGKFISYNTKDVFEVTQPAKVGLPTPHLSTSYIFACKNDFFTFQNQNFNQYLSLYQNSFQHGGVSLEEMLIPLVIMQPKI